MGWTNPGVLAALIGGALMLAVFVRVEATAAEPMFRIPLFRIRAFTAGNIAGFLSALSRGGLQFMLIIWLQGIWLPQHGYSFQNTPLWAGIYMVPLTIGFLIAGPVSGILSDHFGARPFATSGMIGTAVSFALLEMLPINFNDVVFSLLLFLMGLSMGQFTSPNRAAIMNSLPPDQRGAGAGMSTTFQNSAQVLSIGIFFSVMTVGLAASLPGHLYQGLTASGVSAADAHRLSQLPPIGVLFASFLGINPIQHLLGPSVLQHLNAQQTATLTGHQFFPHLISTPFGQGLHYAFDFAIACSVIAATASWLRGSVRPREVAEAARSNDLAPPGEPEPASTAPPAGRGPGRFDAGSR
jgi:MFS family permease